MLQFRKYIVALNIIAYNTSRAKKQRIHPVFKLFCNFVYNVSFLRVFLATFTIVISFVCPKKIITYISSTTFIMCCIHM